MPELPEVEVVRVGLEPAVTGALVTSVTVFDARSLRRHPGPSEDFVDRLVGRTIAAAVRRGKFLWLPLALSDIQEPAHRSNKFPGASEVISAPSPEFPKEAVVVHLGMSGQVLLRAPDAPDDALTRIRIELVSPAHGALLLNFADQRIFGSMAIDDLVPTADGLRAGLGAEAPHVPRSVSHIARDPLDPAFDDARFLAALAKRNTGIKRAMLDQSLVSGIGNIYADEALWAAKVHFEQPTSSLGRAKATLLLSEVRQVLGKALGEGGTSFDAQYVNVNGASGYFSHSLNVYGQQGKPCPRCGRPIIRESFMNRGSHFCPLCQRLR
ncbi:MAG: formamidopyrimidine-DNA glycosylase [Microbacteriaceae bacterium]|jgi:formamidopyrimidine-DNA glycosylase|nr:formamidopyrimidine-DNA glycosylase [Microbacteriaceae bacterium]MDQ1526689.1 formamidopyrimidine-DNA glycosylase [Microbacteriaceae bacterium]